MAWTKKRWILLLTVGLGVLLNPLNSSMISVALTQMQHDFQLTFADASWLISIFYLASAAAQPVMGKLSDMFGAKRLFVSGMLLVVIACLLAPFSPNYGFLLGCRTLQAVGSSTLFPSGMSLVRAQVSKRQAQALAIVSVFSSTSAAFGPTIGGFLIAGWSWPAIFLINLPIILIGFTLALLVLPKTSGISFQIKRIDFTGIILFTLTVLGIILFLLSLSSSIRWEALAGSFVTGTIFYFVEKKKRDPFIDIKALQTNKNANIIYLLFLLINFVYYNYFYGLPTLLQQLQGYSEKHTGLIMLALAGFSVVITPAAGKLIDRKGSKIAILIGAVLLLTGTGALLLYQRESSLLLLLPIMSVLGVSNGFNNIASQTGLYEHVEEKNTGSASGLFQTSRYMGAIISGSFLGMAFTKYVDIAHFRLVLIIGFAVCFMILFLAFKLPKNPTVSTYR